MAFLESNKDRASILILLLGVGIVIALAPFASGLIGGLVLYVVFDPLHRQLTKRIPPALSATLVTLLALLLLVVPTVVLAGLLVGQAQDLASGVVQGPILDRLRVLTIHGVAIGPRIVAAGEELVSKLASGLFGILGTATRIGFNLTIALFVAYYMLIQPVGSWDKVRQLIPFSPANADRLRDRFRDVTWSTMVGTGLTAAVQGTLVAVGFWICGLGNAAFWGLVTAVFAILPVVGSGLVWGPGAATLALSDRWGAAIFMVALGVIAVGNVDLVIRPAVFRRFAKVHTLLTLIGAIAGIRYFGLLGILIGPLALSYFFELMEMYRQEYLAQ
jgi:predicted PurR-regulated permease PerM